MMWFVASLPFWLLGLALLSIGSLSLVAVFRKSLLSLGGRRFVFIGSVACLVLAGVLLLIAAKVAS